MRDRHSSRRHRSAVRIPRQLNYPFESCQCFTPGPRPRETPNPQARSDGRPIRHPEPARPCRRISGGDCTLLVVPWPVHGEFSESFRVSPAVASRGCGANQIGFRAASTGGPARAPTIRMATIRLSKVWRRLPRCSRDPARGEPTRQVRDLPLQLRRHARLGLFPDQHRAPEEAGIESARSAGLQGKYRLRLSAVSGARRFYTLEHL